MAQDADDPRARPTKEGVSTPKRHGTCSREAWRQLARSGRWCT